MLSLDDCECFHGTGKDCIQIVNASRGTDADREASPEWGKLSAYVKKKFHLANVERRQGQRPLPVAPCSPNRWIQVVLSVSPTGGTLRIRDEKSYRPSELSAETVAELSGMLRAWSENRQSGEVVLYEHGTPSSIKSNRLSAGQVELVTSSEMDIDVGAVGVVVVPAFNVSDGGGVDVDGAVVNSDADCFHKFSTANVERMEG